MTKNEVAWQGLIDKYDILSHIASEGEFHITANQVREFREPRLALKFDSTEQLPSQFRDNQINLLPTSNNTYVLSDFLLYEEVPEVCGEIKQVARPYYETTNERSESNVINQLILSSILDDFLETSNLKETFNGRQGSGEFDFTCDTVRGIKRNVHVKGAQIEIDGGFEDANVVVIMEAKNVRHDDFLVRQLYYPYRTWQHEVTKPVRLLFVVYCNDIYSLYEYRFRELTDYSSIELVRSGFYTFVEDMLISFDELDAIRRTSEVEPHEIPFPQCDRLDRVISLLDILNENGAMTAHEIAEAMEFTERQADYYFNGGAYIGLFTKDENRKRTLTRMGELIAKMPYKPRQLALVRQILRHALFKDVYDEMRALHEVPPVQRIMEIMVENGINMGEAMLHRRAQTVAGWLRWIAGLTEITLQQNDEH